jgi:hypothetical protein
VDGIALLRVATLVYVAVLVLALATTLITIAVYLWRIARSLGETRAALVEVARRTQPLQHHFQGLDQLTEGCVNEFEKGTVAIERSVGIFNEADRFEEAAPAL